MEQQNQDTLKQSLSDNEQAAPWVRLPEDAKGASPREEPEREWQVFEAWKEKLNWEERLLEKISNTANLEAASRYIREGYNVAVDLDLATFFDTVNHDILTERPARRLKDKRLLWSIRQMLKAGMMDNEGVSYKREQGMPQGDPLSPLYAVNGTYSGERGGAKAPRHSIVAGD